MTRSSGHGAGRHRTAVRCADAPAERAAANLRSDGRHAIEDQALHALERLADMRDRGLLSPDEYETAKDVIIRELETRQ